MTCPVFINYIIKEHGWASFRLKVEETEVEVGEFGYCTDALGDLVRAALMIATSGRYVSVSFDGEPFEWRLLLGTDWSSEIAPRKIQIRVKTFPDIGLRTAEGQGVLIFDKETTPDAFGRAVLVAAETIWQQYGPDGYNQAWRSILNGFPLRALHALKIALAVQEPVLRIE